MKKTKNKAPFHFPLADKLPSDPSRRALLKGAGIAGAVAVGASPTGAVLGAENQAEDVSNPLTLEALETLTAAEAEVLEAICDCLIPSDEHGPGAKEARAAHYIDRSLASHNIDARSHYLCSLTAINEFAQQQHGAAFIDLPRQQQESLIQALQDDEVPGCSPGSSSFFALLRNHTIDGTFCDPYYGGNRDFVGWDMIQYPGIKLSASETDVRQGAALEPNHQSAYDNATYTKMAANIAASKGGDQNA